MWYPQYLGCFNYNFGVNRFWYVLRCHIYTIMNSCSFINTNPIHSQRLVGCPVPVAVGRGALWPASLSQALTLIGRGRCITWSLRRFCRGMPTCPETFLALPGVSGLLSCAWTHLKKKTALSNTRLVSRTYDKYQLPSSSRTGQFFGRTFLSAVLTLLYCIFVLILKIHSFHLSLSSFWPLKGHNSKQCFY